MLRALALIFLALALSGCPRAVPDGPPPIVFTTDNAAAGVRFEEGVALYEAGQFAAAAEAFRLFGAEFPGDALAVRAELYLGRSLTAAGSLVEARALFRSLVEAPDTPDNQQLAALYLAFVDAVRGDLVSSHASLEAALARDGRFETPLYAVIPGDEALLASLLAEARIARGEWQRAIAELETVAAWSPDDALLFYGYDRGFEIAETRMDVDALSRAFDSGTDFAMTVTGPALAGALTRLGDAATARAVLDEARDPMAALGFEERWTAASAAAEASTGEVRARWGVVLSLSGPNRRAGRAALGGLLLAQDAFEVTAAESTMIVRDTHGSVEGARRAVAELAALQVSAIIGPVEDDLAAAGRETAAELGVPYIALNPTPWPDAVAGTWRMQVDAAAEAAAAVEAAWGERGATRFVIVQPAGIDTPWLEAFAAAAATEIEARGASVEAMVAVDLDPGALQAAAEAAADTIEDVRPDAVVLALPASEAATVASWVAARNIWPSTDGRVVADDGRRLVTWVGNSFMVDPVLLRDAADYLRGAILPAWFAEGLGSTEAQSFQGRFVATYGRAPGALEAFAWDAGSLVRRVIVDEGQRGAARVSRRLAAGVELRGAVGTLRFDELGNAAIVPMLVTVRAGAFAPLEQP